MKDWSDNDKSDTGSAADRIADSAQVGNTDGVSEASGSGVSRRTFSRSSLAGAGVLLTLANSAAWGGRNDNNNGWLPLGKKGKGKGKKGGKKGEKICVSTAILESFHTASHFDHHKKNKKFKHFATHVDWDLIPDDPYKSVTRGTTTCLIGPKH